MKNRLLEVSRQQLLTKTKNSDRYVDQSKGKNRYERRTRSKIATTVAQYNRIDMDSFFKKDILTVGIEVYGETNNYIVTMKYSGVLDEIQRQLKGGNIKLDYKIIYRSLINVFNNGDVFLHCSCPDFKYRQSYWATKNNYNSGPQETIPSDDTNPNDTKGGGCKHCALVLGNLNWLIKVTSTINNYIKYCQQNMPRNYADYIFPMVYGVPYTKAVQLSLFDDGLLPSDQETLDISNKIGRNRGKFKPGNPYRFTKKPKQDPNQLHFNFDDDTIEPNEEQPKNQAQPKFSPKNGNSRIDNQPNSEEENEQDK